MTGEDWLAHQFDEHRGRLKSVAYRLLGSPSDADDAVQNAWLRLSSTGSERIDNLAGWLTTVVAREALHLLRSRRRRREELVGEQTSTLPDPIVTRADSADPEVQVLLSDSVSLALLVVLETLSPPERLAFVLHDVFDVPFEEIALVIDRTPAAARQLASRARRRVRGAELSRPDGQPEQQRAVVDAFYAAANSGDMAALIELLAPDVVFRADTVGGNATRVYRGRDRIAQLARAAVGAQLTPVLVNGLPGVLASRHGEPVSVMAFTVVEGVIVEIDGIRDAARVRRIAATLS